MSLEEMTAYAEREECAQAKDDRDDDLDFDVALIGTSELVIPRYIFGSDIAEIDDDRRRWQHSGIEGRVMDCDTVRATTCIQDLDQTSSLFPFWVRAFLTCSQSEANH